MYVVILRLAWKLGTSAKFVALCHNIQLGLNLKVSIEHLDCIIILVTNLNIILW